jgi:hypothetical protein
MVRICAKFGGAEARAVLGAIGAAVRETIALEGKRYRQPHGK